MSGELGIGIENLTDVELIGSGGFSVVYAATHRLFDRRVAVKVLTNVRGESDKHRFERECRVMGRLSGAANVVTVFHADYTSRGEPYLIMELVEGGTLADRIATQGPFGWQEAVDLIIPISAVLGLAHAEGILHRDIKPENILLDDGVAKLTDFGIASLRDSTGKSSTHVSASWLHSPPETFQNERDERSDLYSLASTLQTLIAGQPPFWSETDQSLHPLMFRLINDPPPPLASHLGPPELAAFLQQAMAKNRDERPQTAIDFGQRLAEIRGVAPPPAGETILVSSGPSHTGYPGGLLDAPGTGESQATITATDGAPAAAVETAAPVDAAATIAPAAALGSPQAKTGTGWSGLVGSPQAETPTQSVQAPLSGESALPTTTVPPAALPSGSLPSGMAPPATETPSGFVANDLPPSDPPPTASQSTILNNNPDLSPAVRYHEPAPRDRTSVRRGMLLLPMVVLVILLGLVAAWALASRDNSSTENDDAAAEEAVDVDTAAAAGGDETGSQSEAGAGGEDAILTVPNVTGLTETEAKEQIEAAGSEVGEITLEPSTTAAEGIVLAQTPGAGGEPGPVDLIVSSGPPADDEEQPENQTPTVLNVVGLTEADATSRLEAVGITATVTDRRSSETVANGFVISQSPASGEATRVSLTVSTGPAPILDPIVPDVRGKTQEQAVQELEALDITVTIGTQQESETVPEGSVIAQSPSAGARASAVTVTISAGPPPLVEVVKIDDVTFSPASPSTFAVGDRLDISIDYTSTNDGTIRIWARPTSGDVGFAGSGEIAAGSGTLARWFTLNSAGSVDRIRVFAIDAATSEVLAEAFFDVNYTWEEVVVGPPATPSPTSPANGSVFDHFPRTTTLTWSSVDGAVSYIVERQFFGGSWSSYDDVSVAGTTYTFDFVGAQPGRWRVSAVDAEGRVSAPSVWWGFEYTI